MPQLSRRVRNIVQSDIRTMSVECEKLGGINLAQGICDTEVPPPVRRAAKEAIDAGKNQYTRLDGIAPLRRAIAQKLQRYNHITADPESEIVVSAGSTGALYSAALATIDRGDEVILFEPYYGYHVNTILALEASPVLLRLHAPDWSFTREQLEAAVTERTRAIIINTPANPSGKVFTRQELEWVGEVARAHDLVIITDEIYEYFLYDGRQHISPASLPGFRDRTITVSGFSKSFSITGWRVGYAVCRADWAATIGTLSDLVYICAPSPLQSGCLAGLEQLTDEFYVDLNAQYAHKRDLICGALADAGLTPSIPQGGYYVLADTTSLPGNTSKEKAMHLLRQTGVAAVPGDSFYMGDGGKNFLRFCYAKTDTALEDACRRLQKFAAVASR